MIKKLDYIDRVDYDKLPQSFKDNRKKLTELGKQLRKLEKDKTKYQSKLTSIKTDLKDLTKQYNKLYNELKPININYSPKCYCVEYTKKDNPTKYLNLVIKSNKKTTIYLGKTDKVIQQLKPYINKLSRKSDYKYLIGDFLGDKISETVDYENPNWIIQNSPKFKDILSSLDSVNSNMSFGEMLKVMTNKKQL